MWWQDSYVLWVGRPRWGAWPTGVGSRGCKGDHKGRPYVPSFSQSEGRSSFRIIAASVLGFERAKVGWCVIQ